MHRMRSRATASALAIGLMLSGLDSAIVAAAEPDPTVVAYLDGQPIAVDDVSKYYCDDFSYPAIQCSRLAIVTHARTLMVVLLTGVDYVTVYDLPYYSGGFMHISQDYGTLLTVGWNDRVSSFKGRNNETGTFWTDWFNGGTSWSFCCNQNLASLGSYNNAFSSVQRT